MSDDARLGRGILLAVTAVVFLGEAALVLLSLMLYGLEVSQMVRILLTLALLWQVWEGARWARWLTAGLFVFGAAFAIGVAVGMPGGAAAKKTQSLMVALGAFYAAMGLAMAMPWVGAYQEVQRKRIGGFLKDPDDF